MKRFTSLLNRTKSHDGTSGGSDLRNLAADSPEANTARAVQLFCESGNASSAGEEVLHLPVIVDTAESSPAAAAASARQIRNFLTRDWNNKPHVQYNAVMLVRILSDNPGPTFTRNFDKSFVSTVKEMLRTCKDQSTQQILRETLDSLEVNKFHDEGLQGLLQMWRKEKGHHASLNPSGSRSAGMSHSPQRQVYGSGGLSGFQQPSRRESGRSKAQLPSPVELASRIEEAKNTAKILMQLIQSTPAEEVAHHELIKEFSERSQYAQKSMHSYINCDNPPPDDDTLQTLIETNEQLSLAASRYQRAILAARRATGGNPSPAPPEPALNNGSAFASAPAPLPVQQQMGSQTTQNYTERSLFQQPHADRSFFQQPQPQQNPYASGQQVYEPPAGPPPHMLTSLQRRESQENSTFAPTPPQRYRLPEIPPVSDPFADPVEHDARAAPLAIEPTNYGPSNSFSRNPFGPSYHQQPASQTFSIEQEPAYALGSGSPGRRDTVEVENAYSDVATPVSQRSSSRPRASSRLSDRSLVSPNSPQRPSPGPWHNSGVTPSYLVRQASATNGLTMHGADYGASVAEIDTHSSVGRKDSASAATHSSGTGSNPIVTVEEISPQQARQVDVARTRALRIA